MSDTVVIISQWEEYPWQSRVVNFIEFTLADDELVRSHSPWNPYLLSTFVDGIRGESALEWLSTVVQHINSTYMHCHSALVTKLSALIDAVREHPRLYLASYDAKSV